MHSAAVNWADYCAVLINPKESTPVVIYYGRVRSRHTAPIIFNVNVNVNRDF